MSAFVVEPGFTNEAHPELFSLKAMPPFPKERKEGQLPENAIRQFFENGYVIVKDFFKPEELDPCKESIMSMVDNLALKLYKAGKIQSLYEDYGFYERLSMIDKEFPGSNILFIKQAVMSQAIKNLWTNERLLNVIEQLIGPDIAGHPVWNLRSKTPHNDVTNVPWHQDSAYLDLDSYKVLQPTAWIPFLDSDENNGCLEVARGGHKLGLVAKHTCCYGGTWYVMLEEDQMAKDLDVDIEKDLITCPVPYGGMILFNNMIPHRSLPNLSDKIRWSIDLRWQTPHHPYGFYGLKQGVVFRNSKDKNHKIIWDEEEKVNRHQISIDVMKEVDDADPVFDTTVKGPWMRKWDIVHHNIHTQHLLQ